jgi:N6-adenosine-specific RNA methylase IME4
MCHVYRAAHPAGATEEEEGGVKSRTIVADPPWRYRGTMIGHIGHREARSAVPYQTMSTDEIAALPIAELADRDAHLYLWTTNTHLPAAWGIVRAWGFDYSTTLVWNKTPRGLIGGATYNICTEFVLFCRRGALPALTRTDRNWWEWPRSLHSTKPEAFIDMVECVSPPPRLELFARRNRLGWDTWGNEAINHIQLGGG